MTFLEEPHLIERVTDARQKAINVIRGKLETDDSLKDRFQWFLSRQLGKGFFDPYFDNLSLDMLAFEVYLHVESNKSKEDIVKDASTLLKDNPKEAEELFADWEEQALPEISDKEFVEKAKKDFEKYR